MTHDQARIARDAYRDFGKGSGHKAGLNFGDCFAYALAKSTGEALLFKGNDFSHTDITPALPPAAGSALHSWRRNGGSSLRSGWSVRLFVDEGHGLGERGGAGAGR